MNEFQKQTIGRVFRLLQRFKDIPREVECDECGVLADVDLPDGLIVEGRTICHEIREVFPEVEPFYFIPRRPLPGKLLFSVQDKISAWSNPVSETEKIMGAGI